MADKVRYSTLIPKIAAIIKWLLKEETIAILLMQETLKRSHEDGKKRNKHHFENIGDKDRQIMEQKKMPSSNTKYHEREQKNG